MVQQRLGNIDDAGIAEIGQAHRHQFRGQQIIAMAARLPHITQPDQIGQQAVHRAARDHQAVGNGGKLQPLAVLREQFQNSEGSFQNAVHISLSRLGSDGDTRGDGVDRGRNLAKMEKNSRVEFYSIFA